MGDKMKPLLIIIIIAFAAIYSASADIMISEIMYNPAGTDTKKEWIELYNYGESDANLSGWKIKDGSTERAIFPYNRGFIIGPNSFIVISRDGENFTAEYPGYNGPVLESSFSLSNEGESLLLIDDKGNDVDYIYYEDIAPEGYSIELNKSNLDNSDINNWKQGKLNGDPGSINIENESVPEFSFPGLMLAFTFIAFTIGLKRK